MPKTSNKSYRRQRRSTFAKQLKLSSFLHVERLESRAHPSSSILGLAVGSLFTDDNRYDLEVDSEEATAAEQSALPHRDVQSQFAATTQNHGASLRAADDVPTGLSSPLGQTRLRETRESSSEQSGVLNSAGVPKWFESLSLSLLSAKNLLQETVSTEPDTLKQLTSSGVTLSAAAPTATPSLQPSTSGNANVLSQTAQPVSAPFAQASSSSGGGGGGGGATVTYSDEVPSAEGGSLVGDATPTTSSFFAEGEGNSSPCVTRYHSCPAPPEEDLTSEVFLDYYDPSGAERTKSFGLDYYFADNEQGDDLGYSIVSPPPAGITASIGASPQGDPLLILSADSPTPMVGTVVVRADDGNGGQVDWTITVYSVQVTGYEVQERAWSEAAWNAPEDSDSDWSVLWKHDNHRWRPHVAPPEANARIYGHAWYDGADNHFADAYWCYASTELNYANWDKWAYGTPIQGGETAIKPTVIFNNPTIHRSTSPLLLSSQASVNLRPPAIGTPAAPRIGVHEVTSPEWQQVPYAQTKPANGLGNQNFAELTSPSTEHPYWAAFPETDGTITYDVVEAKVNVFPAIPAGMAADVHLAWYDPINTIANIPSTPPASTTADTVRDNIATLSVLGSKTVELSAGLATKSAFYRITNPRYGDNFIVAAHPHDGFETEYFFDSNEELNYAGDFPDETNCYANPGRPDFNGTLVAQLLPTELQTPILNDLPSVDLDIDSDNNGYIVTQLNLARREAEDGMEESTAKPITWVNDALSTTHSNRYIPLRVRVGSAAATDYFSFHYTSNIEVFKNAGDTTAIPPIDRFSMNQLQDIYWVKAKGSGPTGFPSGFDKVRLVLWDAISGGNEIKRDSVSLKVQDNHNNLTEWVVPNDWTIVGGSLKTPMPVDENAVGPQKEWTGRGDLYGNAEYNSYNKGDAWSVAPIGGSFALTFGMAFDSRFVQPDTNANENTPNGDQLKLSFVANSGVKIGPIHSQNPIYEAAIIDVVKWVNMAGGLNVFNNAARWAQGSDGRYDQVTVPNYSVEKLTRLLHGIKYGEEDYTKIKLLENTQYENPGNDWQNYSNSRPSIFLMKYGVT